MSVRRITIESCATAADYGHAEAVTRAYIHWLGIDLSYQDVDAEMAAFAAMYGPPEGCYLLARCEGKVAGGVGLRPLEAGICEMKRLYVYPSFTGFGIGRRLGMAILERGADMGYRAMRLDSLAHMTAVQRLYESLGFVDIPPYRYNPDPGTRYLECDLRQVGHTPP